MIDSDGALHTDEPYSEHLARIRAIVTAWHKGEIGVVTKRAKIAEENARFYDEGTRGATGSDLTRAPAVRDEVLHVLVERSGVPVEAASAALAAGRDGAWRANHADDLNSAREALREGWNGYEQIMRSAR